MTVIDHLVYAVPDLTVACTAVERATGIVPEPGGAHTGRGTHNALVSLGDCYLELIAPDPGQPDHRGPRPFGVDARRAATLATFAVRPADGATIDEVVADARAQGYDPGEIVEMERRRPDGLSLRWRLTFPPDDDGTIPFVIDWGPTPRPSDTVVGGLELSEFTLTHPDPAATTTAHRALGWSGSVIASDTPAIHATITGPSGRLHL